MARELIHVTRKGEVLATGYINYNVPINGELHGCKIPGDFCVVDVVKVEPGLADYRSSCCGLRMRELLAEAMTKRRTSFPYPFKSAYVKEYDYSKRPPDNGSEDDPDGSKDKPVVEAKAAGGSAPFVGGENMENLPRAEDNLEAKGKDQVGTIAASIYYYYYQ